MDIYQSSVVFKQYQRRIGRWDTVFPRDLDMILIECHSLLSCLCEVMLYLDV